MAPVARETLTYLQERNYYHDRGGVRDVNGAIGFAASRWPTALAPSAS